MIRPFVIEASIVRCMIPALAGLVPEATQKQKALRHGERTAFGGVSAIVPHHRGLEERKSIRDVGHIGPVWLHRLVTSRSPPAGGRVTRVRYFWSVRPSPLSAAADMYFRLADGGAATLFLATAFGQAFVCSNLPPSFPPGWGGGKWSSRK